jgi:hypothetical protein
VAAPPALHLPPSAEPPGSHPPLAESPGLQLDPAQATLPLKSNIFGGSYGSLSLLSDADMVFLSLNLGGLLSKYLYLLHNANSRLEIYGICDKKGQIFLPLLQKKQKRENVCIVP